MKISLRWIADYIQLEDYFQKPAELGEILTRAGLEVEDLQNPALALKNVFVGHILEKDKHPNADKLSLCRVSTGEGTIHQIVCGAQNHKAGDRVIVALPGAVLPGNFAIKKSAIRGVESSGMLCSYKEIGLPQVSDGIAILPEDAPVGKPYAEYANLDDVIFELKVTPNRADCLSHYGLARELSALLARPLKVLKPELKVSSEITSKNIKVEVRAADLCPRYTGRLIKNVKVGASPDWLKQRLDKVGLASINNIVDATNYVMMELGQPLHAFDAGYISQAHVIIDRAVKGEKFTTLDGTDLTLKGDELTIRDSEKALCLAGTIGGKNSGVSESTTNIFLESAYFLPMSVRKTSRQLGLETDSAYRFSRGVDPRGTLLALDRATEIILQLAGGEATAEAYDLSAFLPERNWISISADLISERLGYQAEPSRAVDFFKRLGCELKNTEAIKSSALFQVKPPSYRFDLEQDMDLVEEYARLFGYDQIPETVPSLVGTPTAHDPKFELAKKMGQQLRGLGFSQAWNFAFVSDKLESKYLGDFNKLSQTGLKISADKIRVLNPLNEDLGVMRSTLVYGLIQNAMTNFHKGNSSGRLYETGVTFVKSGQDYQEKLRLGLVAWGLPKNLWDQKTRYPIVFELKSAIEYILQSLGIKSAQWKTGDLTLSPDFIHGGQWAILSAQGEKIGYIGSVHPQILDEEKIREPVAVCEIELDVFLKNTNKAFRMESISKFQAVERDFAFLMPTDLPAENVIKVIKKAAGALCVDASVFDIYQGAELPAGQRSVAFSLKLQDMNATLQEQVIIEVQNKVLSAIKEQFGLSPR